MEGNKKHINDEGYQEIFPWIKAEIYSRLSNYLPEDIYIGESLYKIPTLKGDQHIRVILAMTSDASIWMWHAQSFVTLIKGRM